MDTLKIAGCPHSVAEAYQANGNRRPDILNYLKLMSLNPSSISVLRSWCNSETHNESAGLLYII
jgi:hypothetical protein